MSKSEIDVLYKGELIARKEAKSLGLKRYFTGKSCKHGHVAQRDVGSGQCCECKRLRTQAWRAKPLEEKFTNKKVAKSLPSQKELLETFDYDPVTGNLYWKHRDMHNNESVRTYKTWKARFENKIAGSRHYANGYIEVRTRDKALHKAHRLIWKIVTGEDPELPVDHKNQIPWDNSWDNLRLATNQDNARNSKTYSKSGFKGVSYHEKMGWVVQWCIEDVGFRKSGFNSAEDAAKYYDKVARELYGKFASCNFEEEKI